MFIKGFEKVAVSFDWVNKKFVSGLNKRMSNIHPEKRTAKELELGDKVHKYFSNKFKSTNDMHKAITKAEQSNSIKPGSSDHKMLRDLNSIARKNLPKRS